MEPVLQVRDLRVALSGKTLMEELSFELKENETLVILGPNGAGKTVLLKALLGLLPHQGIVSWRPGTRKGYVPQRVPLAKDLPITVADFFSLKRVPEDTVHDFLRKLGLADPIFLETQLGVLSFGEFQRVLIAWALVQNPDVLLFDEPMAGVDIGGEDVIHAFLHQAQAERKFSVILVTHDLTTVYREATHVLCMNQKKFCYGSPREILDPGILEEIYGRQIRFYGHTHD